MSNRFPFERLKKGESFFVPSLAPEKTKIVGERAAIAERCRCKAEIGIYRGMLGVMFTLTHRYVTPH